MLAQRRYSFQAKTEIAARVKTCRASVAYTLGSWPPWAGIVGSRGARLRRASGECGSSNVATTGWWLQCQQPRLSGLQDPSQASVQQQSGSVTVLLCDWSSCLLPCQREQALGSSSFFETCRRPFLLCQDRFAALSHHRRLDNRAVQLAHLVNLKVRLTS